MIISPQLLINSHYHRGPKEIPVYTYSRHLNQRDIPYTTGKGWPSESCKNVWSYDSHSLQVGDPLILLLTSYNLRISRRSEDYHQTVTQRSQLILRSPSCLLGIGMNLLGQVIGSTPSSRINRTDGWPACVLQGVSPTPIWILRMMLMKDQWLGGWKSTDPTKMIQEMVSLFHAPTRQWPSSKPWRSQAFQNFGFETRDGPTFSSEVNQPDDGSWMSLLQSPLYINF